MIQSVAHKNCFCELWTGIDEGQGTQNLGYLIGDGQSDFQDVAS